MVALIFLGMLLVFTVWMVADCIRNEPAAGAWLVLFILLPGIGLLLYFIIRFRSISQEMGRAKRQAWLNARNDALSG